ncbi:alpha/beta hydrolase [Niveibacterium microcysteis]|uniref:Alpha/beta fold hydrolase n=1 Tax=Niveibacterium microcysteis TaxID=2811415 RepID=A0ABX7M5H6_9RHOO|nr:alpha/beta fold hydrolase [Niveibacterium microcysteis]QSI77019.1 alpha/beta fold hydrolase [Niveibacterium microcysteis]
MRKVLPTEKFFIDGPVGPIEILRDTPEGAHGLAIIAHPHPLFGGTNTNKVAHTLARTLCGLGYCALRPNFRGVGGTAGTHDHGDGESEDLLAVIDWAQAQYGDGPLVLAGFSFGAFVQTRVAKRLAAAGRPAKRLVLVGTASGFIEGARTYDTEAVTPDTIVIHGNRDETVPLENVLAWAEPLQVPVVVVPGADHFFHTRLHILRDIIVRAWRE